MQSSIETPFEVKFVAGTGVFEGYASVFHVVDRVRDIILPGAFRDSLAQFRTKGRLPPLLWQHNTQEPIGAWREVYEDDHGLFVKGELFIRDIPLAKEAYKLLQENVVSGLSIGYRASDAEHDRKSGVRYLKKLDLLEISLVTFPANEQARVIGPKRLFTSGEVPSKRDCEAFLRDAGMSHRQAKGFIAQGYKSLTGGRDAEETNAQAELELLNHKLLRAIAEMKAGFDPSQPRVPAGNSDTGGQWSRGGTSGSARAAKPAIRVRPYKMPLKRATMVAQNKPTPTAGIRENARRINQNAPAGLSAEDLAVDPRFGLPRWYVEGAIKPTVSPLDFVGFPGASIARGTTSATEARIAERLNAWRRQRDTTGINTIHGSKRFRQRGISDNDIEEALASSIRAGKVFTKKGGRRNELQTHYQGSNGLLVIIAEEGRNTGKIVTLFGKNPQGKLK